jgi:Zn-dependent peptidase ImmA (M78 family)/DNA-binding XRE family transcriptional regulator
MQSVVPNLPNPRILGKRLQAARKGCGLTQQQAAHRIGVARTTLIAMEQGERRVQPEEIVQLASVYGRTVNELLRQSEPVEVFAIHFRQPPSSMGIDQSDVDITKVEFQRLCEDYLELEQMQKAPLSRKYPVEYSVGAANVDADAEDIAVVERNRLGLGDGPLLNLREILELDVGIRIFTMDLPSRVAAMFAYSDQLGACIAVNRKHPEERRRMSLAHDYGHFLTSRYQPVLDLVGGYQRLPESERLAETFARAFLMPATGLSRRFNDLRRSQAGRVTPADLCRLAHVYGVSVEAMTLRLEELRLLKAGTWDRLRLSGFRVREAQQLLKLTPHSASDEVLPLRYRYLAAAAFEDGALSEGQLARFLRVDRLEARRIVEELSMYQDISDEGTVHTQTLDLDTSLLQRTE